MKLNFFKGFKSHMEKKEHAFQKLSKKLGLSKNKSKSNDTILENFNTTVDKKISGSDHKMKLTIHYSDGQTFIKSFNQKSELLSFIDSFFDSNDLFDENSLYLKKKQIN